MSASHANLRHGSALDTSAEMSHNKCYSVFVLAIELTLVAQEDLTDIAQYGRNAWGEEKTDIYVNEISSCFQRIRNHPYLNPASPESDDVRMARVNRHIVFYSVTANNIVVNRILNDRSDHQSSIAMI